MLDLLRKKIYKNMPFTIQSKTNLRYLIAISVALFGMVILVYHFFLLPEKVFSQATVETYDPKWLGDYVPAMKGEAANYDYADPDVIVIPTGYRLYVGGGGKRQIVSFFSTDGINWSRDSGVSVLDAAFPDAITLPDGRIRIYFQGFVKEINSAISNDNGLTFTKEPGIRVSAGWHQELDADAVAAPSVVKFSDGRYRMYYIGRKLDTSYCNGMRQVILSAISEDGLNFSLEEGTRIVPEDWPSVSPIQNCKWSYLDGPEAVITKDGQVKLYFWGVCEGICLSQSKDGLNFNRVGSVFLNSQLPTAPQGNAGDPALLQLKDGTWLLFYNSRQDKYNSVFIAKQVIAVTSATPISTSKETLEVIKKIDQKKEDQFMEYKFPPAAPVIDTSKDGPWNNDLWIAESRYGTKFRKAKIFIKRAGVPSITSDTKGRLIAAFQWFGDKEHFDQVALAFSEDNGKTWSEPQPMKIANFPDGYMRPFDPTVVTTSNGKIRMYFTSKSGTHQPAIFSAISDDGLNYRFEPGERFGVSGEMVVDSAIGKINDTWHLISPVNKEGIKGTAYHAVSDDGLNFSRKSNIQFQKNISWIGNLVKSRSGKGLRFYGSGEKIWRTFTKDGQTWSKPKETNIIGGDPAVIRLSNKRYLMIYVGQLK